MCTRKEMVSLSFSPPNPLIVFRLDIFFLARPLFHVVLFFLERAKLVALFLYDRWSLMQNGRCQSLFSSNRSHLSPGNKEQLEKNVSTVT